MNAVRRAEMVGNYEVRSFPEGAGPQSFKEGQFVKFSSQKLVVHGDNQDLEAIVGMAMKDATGTENSMIPVAVFKPGTLVRLSAYHLTPASAVCTLSSAAALGIQIVAISNKTVADVATFGNDSKAPLKLIAVEGDSDSELYRRIICAVKANHCAMFSGLATEA